MQLTIIGCGDAFGSGGRLQSAYVLDHAGGRVLIDCGVTTTMGLAARKIDPNAIRHIVVTHLHGDHYGGILWFLMHAVIVAKRTAPLAIYGPPGIEARVTAAGELLYPGMGTMARTFTVSYHEMTASKPIRIEGLDIAAFEVVHPSGAPSHALRCAADGRVFTFSGDTKWTESLVEAARGADLFLTECYEFERDSGVHLNWLILGPQLDRIGARRVVLTHMSETMLARRGEVRDARITFAEDGAVYEI